MPLSMAVAQWPDARKQIHDFVDEIKSWGFSFNHDFVLKACLTLGDSDSIRFKVDEEQIHKYRDRLNRLANLQLLEGSTNTSNGAKLSAEWLRAECSEEAGWNHCRLHDLGEIPTDVTGFLDFQEARRTRILGS